MFIKPGTLEHTGTPKHAAALEQPRTPQNIEREKKKRKNIYIYIYTRIYENETRFAGILRPLCVESVIKFFS